MDQWACIYFYTRRPAMRAPFSVTLPLQYYCHQTYTLSYLIAGNWEAFICCVILRIDIVLLRGNAVVHRDRESPMHFPHSELVHAGEILYFRKYIVIMRKLLYWCLPISSYTTLQLTTTCRKDLLPYSRAYSQDTSFIILYHV